MTTRPRTHLEFPLASYPGAPRFALDLVTDAGRVGDLSSRLDLSALSPPPARADRSSLAAALTRSNKSWGNDVTGEISDWASGETVAVIGGQQVGFAGGPLLTIVKIASLLRIKRDLEAKGIKATAFFWMATEDHDFAEVACLDWPKKDGGLLTFRSPHPASLNRPVGTLPIPPVLVRHFIETTGIDHPNWLREGITFGDSFAELIAEVFSGKGLVLVDSTERELRRMGAPLIRALADSIDDVESAITKRSSEIEAAGYKAQVVPNQDGHYSMLYLVRNGERLPLRRNGDGWFAGEQPIETPELLSCLDDEPESISTGALVRPLLQDYVFQPSIFLGGPAEVAYYSQILPLHEKFEIVPPHVALRGHVLAAPEKVLRAMDRYGVTPDELTDSADEILERRERDGIGILHGQVHDLARAIDQNIAPIRENVASADKAMNRSISRTFRRIRYHVDKLEQRGARAILRRDAERHRAIHRLCGTLFPGGTPQDRRSAWVGLWYAYQDGLTERLIEVVRPDSDVFLITGV